jgi:hypothetical protein
MLAGLRFLLGGSGFLLRGFSEGFWAGLWTAVWSRIFLGPRSSRAANPLGCLVMILLLLFVLFVIGFLGSLRV